MGPAELMVLVWAVLVPVAAFLLAVVVIYFTVRKAVRDELRKIRQDSAFSSRDS